MSEKDFFIQNPAEKWKAKKPDQVIEVVSALPEALRKKDFDQIKESLRDPQFWRGAIINREGSSKNLVLLRDSFDLMFMEEFEGKDLYSMESEKVLDWIHKIGWPENILNEMVGVAYHLRDDCRFFRLLSIISENQRKFNDPSIFPRALHDLSAWESMVEKNPDKAIKSNKEALGVAVGIGDEILETKIRYGMTYSKKIKPKDKARDFEKYRDKFFENGDEIEAVRSMVEAADALEKSYDLGGYTNNIIHAHKILAEIYQERKDPKKAEDHRKQAENLERAITVSHKKA